jgi:hypothetical protein
MAFNLDKPETWANTAVHHPPSSFRIDEFQERLNAVMGLSDTGLPMVRVVWAGDIAKTYSKFYVSWIGSRGVMSELRAKYKYCTIQIPETPDIIDIPPPRWILEEWNHPGQYFESWEAARFDKEGREIRPEPPPEGYYSHLFTIARHNKFCCERAKKDSVVCWGNYRKPDGRDIAMIQEAKHRRDADKEVPLDRPLSLDILENVAKETASAIQTRQEKIDDELRQYIDENAVELICAFTGIEMNDKMKKFSFPKTHQSTESGLIVPK